ncbi:Soluble lytic murein transglycosylase [Candidatus Rhodobacter oscarellae]|uniref:Soluble lytic murein transglycosylase n=1 Tax=Candidatus Rhodobacter oscarellae TaxID=1675527 RepID=A0A0J9E539_9RHOB|nr:transglycosylase SLT domain-containing protein [Candidatus Rhodobacter lobularis]KMW57856.1 Soluble lytic murein transglycosylase [Candidatus Rhodobacter lobularis]
MKRMLLICLLMAACGRGAPEPTVAQEFNPPLYPGESQATRALVNKWADHYDIPCSLLHRVIQRESDYRAGARNGPYWGMMQILPETARGIGFQGANANLLDADTNLEWGTKYLRGAWLLSYGDEAAAVGWYARGYYYEARNRCMLVATALRDREVRKHCPNGSAGL